ncbi:hypothetical protein GUJ93_ZPchr0005g15456 [Zizania palustris]|uniref:Uncharacterized protein n=1 Tax=Zizania palustris TaxID=103762 RepID=A0A8J5STY7_ZIZPA|nr:hypothetical protein GUJ93_ZPchr0005g15456 [Zizania palustris]
MPSPKSEPAAKPCRRAPSSKRLSNLRRPSVTKHQPPYCPIPQSRFGQPRFSAWSATIGGSPFCEHSAAIWTTGQVQIKRGYNFTPGLSKSLMASYTSHSLALMAHSMTVRRATTFGDSCGSSRWKTSNTPARSSEAGNPSPASKKASKTTTSPSSSAGTDSGPGFLALDSGQGSP